MFRIFIFFLIFYLLYRIIKKFFQPSHPSNNAKPKQNKKIEGEKILPCANCNVYIPESKAYYWDNKTFCSKKCIESYKQSKGG